MSQIEAFPEIVPAEDPNRRYTPESFNALIKRYAGVTAWDLDVAADAESHLAPRWFSVQPYAGSAGVNGLAQSWLPPEDWIGTRRMHDGSIMRLRWGVFCNPPFDDLEPWVVKAWDTMDLAEACGLRIVIAFVLPGNRHEQPFWQEHIEPFRDGRALHPGNCDVINCRLDLHFPPGRQAYAKPGSQGLAVGSADFPSAVLVWR